MTHLGRVLACLGVSLVSTVGPAFGQNAAPGGSPDIQRELLAARDAGGRAYDGCDMETFGKMLHANYITTPAPGRFRTREQLETEWNACKPSASAGERLQGPLRVTPYGGGALVEGVRSVRRQDGEWSAPRRFLEVWVKDGGRWQELAHHGTVIDVSTDSTRFALMPPRRGDRQEAVATTGQTRAPGPADDERAAISEVNSRYSRAVGAGDVEALRSLMAEDFVQVSPSGVAYGRDQYLKEVKAAPGYKASESAVRQHGDLAVVAGAVSGDNVFERRYTRVWVRSGGAWKVVISQASPIYRHTGWGADSAGAGAALR